MANPASFGTPDRDIEQAFVTLKKGTQLIKYSRKGKPKFRAFRLSPDETTLIWLSHGEEKNLKLSLVSRIVPGQRTAVFRRYLRPEKDYLSFSLLYNNGERSLDLICKDKVEAELWLAGLKALIGKNRNRRTKSDLSDLIDGDFFSSCRPFGATLEFTSSIGHGSVSVDLGSRNNNSLNSASSDAGSDHANMQLRTSTGDGFRISISSTPSCSSGGSGPDDIESLGDVYVWGEIWSDGVSSDGSGSSAPTKVDVLTPKPLESNVVLDVHQIACGSSHIALVTKQGEVFTWGEESGGRLGHGLERDFSRPQLVEFLAAANVDFIACGAYHTCAVSSSGDLFTWGDGTHNAGLLGHGSDTSHWIPKRVSGSLEGLQVLSVACGAWHSALATSSGKLFTFGDGAFGVLGHGDRESVPYPKEVQALNGLRTIKVACGVWHTAAIVEFVAQPGGNGGALKKLFTWGDGDKHRLGRGNTDSHLLPGCVTSLADYNFRQLACGHTMTIALTTSGHLFSMGGTAHGQLGNPTADGKIPCLVQDNLVGEFIEEISCGSFHVAVLTSRSEVYTWGSGSNGQLGHGDAEDRNVPTLVEALKDRHVKNISCGSNFTSTICIHKWVSGADQSLCSGCRQAFGFTRKRHHCYNCGLVHCHACSSKKVLKAALAPTPGKPHRVCDACHAKLKAAEAGSYSNVSRKITFRSMDMRDRMDVGEVGSSRLLLSPSTAPVKLEIKPGKSGLKADAASSLLRTSQIQAPLPLKDAAFLSLLSTFQSALKPIAPSTPPLHPASSSRPTSPYSSRPSPPPSSTPAFSRSVIDSLIKTNDALKEDMATMQNQIQSLKQKSETQEVEMQKLQAQAQDAAQLAAMESSKCNDAKEVVRAIQRQLKKVIDEFPSNADQRETIKAASAQMEAFLATNTTLGMPSSLQQLVAASNHQTESDAQDHAVATGCLRSAVAAQSGEIEGIEQFDRGVYVTFVQLPDGAKIFKRIRFSKRGFQEQQAETWLKENRDRLLVRYGQGHIASPSVPAIPASSSSSIQDQLSTVPSEV